VLNLAQIRESAMACCIHIYLWNIKYTSTKNI